MSDPLLIVDDLEVTFPGRTGVTRAVRNASFTLGRERLGIVGEVGLGQIDDGPRAARPRAATRHRHRQDDVLRRARISSHCTERDWQELRGRRMSMVMQDPKYSLNPVKTVGKQIGETCLLHLRHQPQGGRAADAGDARGGADPRSRAGLSTSIRTSSRAAWASAS